MAAIRPEWELLLLALRLDLGEARAARMAELVAGNLDWAEVLAQGARFGVLPLLHHHLGRAVPASGVPEATREVLARAYLQTSLKNLRLQGLLRRFLLQAGEAGLPVILLKGAYLSRWVYGDVGLRPMSDLDVLCREEDEPALARILGGMGAFQAWAPDEVGAPREEPVLEKVAHGAPWWFKGIVRIEVHTHLLARNTPEDAWVLERLWAEPQVNDWDGLRVLSLQADLEVIHLASHLYKHLEGGLFHLYWVVDVREMLRRREAAAGMADLARRLDLEGDCEKVVRPLGAPWDGRPGLSEAASNRQIAAWMEIHLHTEAHPSRATAAGYFVALRGVTHVRGRWNQARYLLALVLSPPAKLKHRYRITRTWQVPFYYLADPFIRASRAVLGLIDHVR